ncbi:phosphate regulon sensor histidine kinase PhoR [Hydrocarboniphaga sp.]|uniref:phosphate regulon sensor histidine kinase PhoR n=1 Tax=Hydrocarboniphaga sp. TaxID=2033016 RepID=UPI003D117037
MASEQPETLTAAAAPAEARPEVATTPLAVTTTGSTFRRSTKRRPFRSVVWRRELGKLAGMIAAGTLLGWMFGNTLLGCTVAITLYLGNHLRYLRHLRLWLAAPKQHSFPDTSGIWGEVFEALQALEMRNSRRKKKLAEIVAEFQASTAALPDGAVVLGESGMILWFNRAAQAMLGLRVSHDIGIRVANLIRHPNFTNYIASEIYEGEVEVPSPINRAVSLSLRIIPYGNNQRLMIVRDVSEIRRLETARRDFVSNASHELRTPLTVLRGYLDMLDPETREGRSLAGWKMPISEMRQQSARMESLINDMLKLARLESDAYEHKQELLDASMILNRSVDEGRSMSAGAHRFDVSIQPGLKLFGREVEAQSIFSNLITNAVRYTPPGGSIRVRWWSDAEGAHLSVADSGIGIAEDDIPRLTERFYRVDVGRSRASGGTGLGLSIVKHALERHEGSLRIESELGVGTTFFCDFPPHRAHSEVEPARVARSG